MKVSKGGFELPRRKFLGTVTGVAALALLGLERRAIADIAPSDRLIADYTGRLCYNENPLGPSLVAAEAIREQAALAHRYPDWYGEALITAVAARYDVSAANVICGCGATDLLRLCAMAFTQRGGNVIVPNPSYTQFPTDAQLFGSAVQYVSLDSAYAVDLAGMRSRVNSNTTAVCITNPNNPTGTIVDSQQLADFINSLPLGVVTIIDEAYLEYISSSLYPTAVELVRDNKNVVVVKTMSKVYGLAGARIGYAIGKSSLITGMRDRQFIAAISRSSLAAGVAALNDTNHVNRTVESASSAKNYCYSRFRDMGLTFIPSEASFFMVNVGRDADPVRAQLATRGIYVRTGWGMTQYLRVSSGILGEMREFILALQDILGHSPGRLDPGSSHLTELFQASPNPFNSSTNIRIFLPDARSTRLEVFDIQGRLVRKLADSTLSPGEHSFTWQGVDESGRAMASGTYFYRLSAGEDTMTRRMMLIK